MKQNRIYRTALFNSLVLNIVLYIITILAFIYFHNLIIPDEQLNEISIQTLRIHFVVNFIETFVLAFILYVLNLKLLANGIEKKFRLLFLQAVYAIAVSLVISILFSQILSFLSNYGISPPFLPGNIIRDLFISFFVMLTSSLIYLSGKQQQTALENRTLIAENMRTRYEALKNQVDPHFLFNSLNTLNALIKIDADKAQQYVQQLSSVFRYTLQNDEIISLEEELKFTQAYCHLMQIRYGDCLRFEYHIDPRFYTYKIIPLSLQILVENAIKHNVVTVKNPLTISFVSDDKGSIRISNPIQLKKEQESGEGIGLVNLSERYRLMWQQEIVIAQKDGIFSVEITLVN